MTLSNRQETKFVGVCYNKNISLSSSLSIPCPVQDDTRITIVRS